MSTTAKFFQWWYEQWGIGGWVIFMILAIGAITYMIYDTQSRRIRAVGWLIGTILPALLLLPSAFFSLSLNLREQMQNLIETFFYLGVIGGVVPVVVAVGYTITYKGLRGCVRGHIYDAREPECPHCAQIDVPPVPFPRPEPPVGEPRTTPQPLLKPTKPKVAAWLVDERTNRNYQLNQGDTRIGRGRQNNDIVITDKAVSREHMLIREQGGHFTIYDRASSTGTFVNGSRIEGSLLLEPDDVIEIGDTKLRFVTSRR